MLKDLKLKAVYRTETDNLLKDFYLPALCESTSYDRAVGFFSASLLSYAAQGISALVHNDGRLRLVVGGELSPEDVAALERGYDARSIAERLCKAVLNQMDDIEDALVSRRLEALAWLVAVGRLDIKMALKPRGMFHEKIGILQDAAGDRVIFQGSANETTYALLPDFNFESINVFVSWRPELQDHYQPYVDAFERLWRNSAHGIHVVDFPDALRNHLIQVAKAGASPIDPAREQQLAAWLATQGESTPVEPEQVPCIPAYYKGEPFELRPHQKAALQKWKSHDFQGILELATGAGKTVTAIYGAIRMFDATKRLFVVIAVPYINLADQWVAELNLFNIFPLRCYENQGRWQNDLQSAVGLFRERVKTFCCVVVVNRTLVSEQFQKCLSEVPGESLLWIGDECHHHGSELLCSSLPSAARARLGLSATPGAEADEDGCGRLSRYYGPVVDRFTLRDALDAHLLTPYQYHVVPVELTSEEAEAYIESSKTISRLAAQLQTSPSAAAEAQLVMKLLERARLLGAAQNKLPALRELLANQVATKHTLFYCGDGTTEDPVTGEENRQIELISQCLHGLNWRTSRFTSRESATARRDRLNVFRLGEVDALVAIRCLDEGIDIPGCRAAYLLASSCNPRQQIQRRGRILRKSPNKHLAVIYDFLVVLPMGDGGDVGYERNLLEAEMRRVAEFAVLATNKDDVVRCLSPLLRQYGLLHVLPLE